MTDASFAALAAKQTITEVLYRYCRGLDRLDREMMLSVSHPDSTVDYENMFVGSAYEFVDWVFGSEDATGVTATHSHQVTNVLIELLPDGDHAVSEAYVTVYLRTQPQDGVITDLVVRGRYLDEWSRRAGTWAIDHRQFVTDGREVFPFPVADVGDGSQSLSRRDRDDPSFALFAH